MVYKTSERISHFTLRGALICMNKAKKSILLIFVVTSTSTFLFLMLFHRRFCLVPTPPAYKT